MKIPAGTAEASTEVKKSKFIAVAVPTHSYEEIKGIVSEVRKKHPGASHTVHASVVGDRGSMFSFSDDGEPKGTAGRPALEVLKGSGITDVTVCVVRYFGGILLGTGGLVKAYSDAVKSVLSVLQTEERIPMKSAVITVPYSLYSRIKSALAENNAVIDGESFEIDIEMRISFPESNEAEIIKAIDDIGRGSINTW